MTHAHTLALDADRRTLRCTSCGAVALRAAFGQSVTYPVELPGGGVHVWRIGPVEPSRGDRREGAA